MGWHARLDLDYASEHCAGGAPRTVARHRHSGPLRVLKALYPEGDAVCHHVLVHPPGGLVGGDRLDVGIALAPFAHAVLTTPGAARFYRSEGDDAAQRVAADLGAGARLEWLPQESIVHRGARAINRQRFALAPGAEMFGWDLLALGLPASGDAFDAGRVVQDIEVGRGWRDTGAIDAGDRVLLDSPLGLGGRRAIGLLWWAAGDALDAARVEQALAIAREACDGRDVAPGDLDAAATQPAPHVVVVRVLAARVEPAARLLRAVHAGWRHALWGLRACPPRVWST